MAWLVNTTSKCLGRRLIEKIHDCLKHPYSSMLLELNELDIVVEIPCTQMPEAWANFLHVFCLNDYMLDRLGDIISPGSIVIDAGAFLGFFSLHAARLMKRQGLIIAIEPNPLIRSYLYDNLLMNGLASISRVDPRLVCGYNGLGELYVTEYLALSSMNKEYIEVMGEKIIKKIKMPCVTLNKLIEAHGIRRVDVLKLDVEGAELSIIKESMQSSILNKLRIRGVIIELHPPYRNIRDSLLELGRALRINGYDIMEINPLIPGWSQVIVVLK
jgi:FkbM family methyltransferase